MVKLLGGLAVPAKGMITEGHPWFGKPSFELKYDPEAAIKLLAEAGYGPKNPVKIKVIISPSGSGQTRWPRRSRASAFRTTGWGWS
jgi:ABC-type transport system substrate-binding protein